MTSQDDIRASKAELRRRMREVRGAIPQRDRARRSDVIEERLLGLRETTSARTILLFYSFGSEVATGGMARRLHAKGKRLLLPYLDRTGMQAAEVRPGDELTPAWYGAREPARRVRVDPADVDLVVTPGLAFDRDGRRLGYGGGHYDRFLGRLDPQGVRVGIGFAEQLVDRVPAGAEDQRVDLVVTDDGVVDCRTG